MRLCARTHPAAPAALSPLGLKAASVCAPSMHVTHALTRACMRVRAAAALATLSTLCLTLWREQIADVFYYGLPGGAGNDLALAGLGAGERIRLGLGGWLG